MPDYALGAKPRPFDEHELSHRLTAHHAGVDLSTPRSLAQYLPAVFNQDAEGSCTANAVASAAMALAAIAGIAVPEVIVSREWLYYQSRLKEGTLPLDHGATIAGALDVALAGVPRDSLWPYDANPRAQPPAGIDADCPNQNWLGGHQPFYASDPGGFVSGTVASFDVRQFVLLGMNWLSDFDSPSQDGVLPEKVMGQIRGGHCVLAWGYVPPAQGLPALVACRNSWGEWTNAGVKNILPDAMPGDFFIPQSHFGNGNIWECRSAVARVQPKPQPQPKPDPNQQLLDQFFAWLPRAADWASEQRSRAELDVIVAEIQYFETLMGITR